MINKISNGEEFFESKRLFSLAFVEILKKKGAAYTRDELKSTFKESTFLLFPIVLTADNLNYTVMNFKPEDVKFK